MKTPTKNFIKAQISSLNSIIESNIIYIETGTFGEMDYAVTIDYRNPEIIKRLMLIAHELQELTLGE